MSQYPTDLFRTSCGGTTPLELNISGPGWAGAQRRVFDQPFVLVGRHERNSLHLEDEAISRRHAYLQQLGGRVFCVDLGSRTGVRWGGESLPSGWLHPDRGIQIGPFSLELARTAGAGGGAVHEVADEGDPLQDRVNDLDLLPCITVERDDKIVAQMRMNRVLVLVGSSPACRVRLREAGVAKYHCSLVSTPEGIWMIDLLSETGTYLDGQPVPWALVEEDEPLRVGPYLLRFSYRSACEATPSNRPSKTRADTPVRVPVLPANLLVQTLASPRAEQPATEKPGRLSALQAELDQVRERLRDAEVIRQQLADSRDECARLRDQAQALETQVAEASELQIRLQALEASSRELEVGCAERDQWQAEAQNLQTRLTSEAAEREQWQQRLEAIQRLLDEERETARAAGARLELESATLLGVRTEFTARNAEYKAALQRLEETQDGFTQLQDQTRGLQAELNQTHECLRDTEALRQQLADNQAECTRLRDQARALEIQLAEVVSLKAQLEAAEASARQIEVVCSERDQWQTEAQALQTRLASEAAEREQWQERLEGTQRQLEEEREAARAVGTRLEDQSTILQGVRDEFAARNAEYSETKQRLEEAENALACLQNETRGIQAELNQTRGRLQDTEVLRQQLPDSQTECAQLHQQVRVLEIQVAEAADLKARLEVAQASSVRELEIVCAERDQWQAEVQTLQARLTGDSDQQEHLARLAAELHAAHEERERLYTQQQASFHLAEQAKARVSDLERALADATAAHERTVAGTRAGWESERQALETRLEQERQRLSEATQAAIRNVQTRAETALRDVQARVAAEQQRWRKELEGAEGQIAWERGLFQEQAEQMRRQIAVLQADRDRLAAKLAQVESLLRVAEERSRNEAGPAAEPEHLRRLAVVDQIFAEFRGLQAAPLLAQVARKQGQDKVGT
ncbi:MAG TPA: FHA domain-containing protein [Gemmataceae bacterium]|jgi:pSer/pThr/pTyr-binding forkhead associated (FHA) protein/chromosome segregation ATPase